MIRNRIKADLLTLYDNILLSCLVIVYNRNRVVINHTSLTFLFYSTNVSGS